MIDPRVPVGWLPITVLDEGLYDHFFQQTEDPFSYENNWAFISQETRDGGIRYHHEGILLTGVVRHQASEFLFLFPPLGSFGTFFREICRITNDLARSTGKRIVLRKVSRQLCDFLIGTGKFRPLAPDVFTHPRDIPEDVWPQVIIDVLSTSRGESSRLMKVRNHLRYFSRNNPATKALVPDRVEDVARLIAKWDTEYHRRRGPFSGAPSEQEVDCSAYTVFAHRFSDRIDGRQYFGKIIYVGADAVGFTLAGRISARAAALYSSISLTSYRGASEYLLCELLHELSSAGIDSLNMGGSETKGLFDFKNKFCIRELRHCYDAEYDL